MSCDDRLLVQRVKQGDERAFAELVTRYQDKAFRIIYRFTNNVEDAKDLSQEAFVRVYRSIGRFKEGSSFYTWFYRILINLCIDFRRSRSILIPFSQLRKREGFNESLEEALVEDEGQANLAKVLLTRELNEKITQAIEALSAKQRTVFILRNYEGLALKEIAEVMNCAQGTVKSHLARAIGRLENMLGPYVRES